MPAINTAPRVDVMRVLLISFLITIPVINRTVQVHLPQAGAAPAQPRPEDITVAVDKDGNIYWNSRPAAVRAELLAHVEAVALTRPQPQIQLRRLSDAPHEAVGRVMHILQRGGMPRFSFLTTPARDPR